MRVIDLKELKRIETNILIHVHEFCEKNSLRYFLSGGTLLGAVRHQGFIPWDDDIDIVMPREDFMLFIKAFKNDQFSVLKPGDRGYFYNFAKVVDTRTSLMEEGVKGIPGYGVYIDVFPIDGMPSNENERLMHFSQLNEIRKNIHRFSAQKPKIRKNVIRLLNEEKNYIWSLSADLNKYQDEYLKCALQYPYNECEYIYMSGGAYGIKEIYEKRLFSSSILVQFEGKSFRAPALYEEYLTLTYGDFMKLPPADKQVSHHHFAAYYFD